MLAIVVLTLCCRNKHEKSNDVVNIDYSGFQLPTTIPITFVPGLFSLPEINEYGGHFSPDGKEFYFTRFKPGSPAEIMSSAFSDSKWSTPISVTFVDEFPGSESCFSPDGKKFFYVHFYEQNGKYFDQFFTVNRTENGWSTPQSLNITNHGDRQISPSVSKNYNLYFSGNLNTPEDKDIFVSYYENGEYSSPINLGESVNSEFYEEHVFVSPEEDYIIFDSYRPGGFGGSDLYISFRNSDGSWSNAQNLGATINSEFYDWYPNITPDGKYLIFARTINGKIDLYWCEATELI
jgi:hypothetical protein